MDGDRFDLLARALGASSRRAIVSALTGLTLLGPDLAAAGQGKQKRKNKKKKCKRNQKKCGKKCIPKNGCCPRCGNRETCSVGFCICAPGTSPCRDLCCVDGAEICYQEGGGGARCLSTL